MGSDVDPDPVGSAFIWVCRSGFDVPNFVDPDPHTTYPDPHHWKWANISCTNSTYVSIFLVA